MDRLTNYFFLLVLIFVFVLLANPAEQYQIVLGLILSAAFCLLAFFFNMLTLDGAQSAGMLGTVVFGLEGWPAGILLLFFFVSSSLISRKSVLKVETESGNYIEQVRRNGLQVWSNSFWFAVFLIVAFITEYNFFLVASLGALSTATADTWATELGSRRFKVRTYLINGLEKVDPGTEGGISIPGTLAALAGSLIMAAAAVYVFSFLKFTIIFTIFMAGFLGCMADSYLGAAYQRDEAVFRVPGFYKEFKIEITNNFVNWASTGIGSLIALTLNLL